MPSWDVRFDLNIDLSNPQLVRLVERAHALAAVIREIPIPPYLQKKLDAVNILRAVRGTTAIEGSLASVQEVQDIMDAPQGTRVLAPSRGREEQEVRNAQTVMDYIAKLIRRFPDHPLTQRLIRELHRQVTKDIPYENNEPGYYRSHPVAVGTYSPPETGDEVRILMKDFVEWLKVPPAVNFDPIILALVAHFYLISIHPFGDGNGRTSRAVESLLLYRGKVNARGFYSLSNYYYQRRDEYVWHLNNARFSSENSLTPFMMFALNGLVEELQSVHTDVINEVRVISFRDFARETFLTHGLFGTKAGERGFQFLMGMSREAMPMPEVYALPLYKGVTRRTIQRDIKFLRTHDLVVLQDGELMPNLEVMSQFTAMEELEEPMEIEDDPPEKTEEDTMIALATSGSE
jgi:Fic family protein